ncbi:MAG: sugar ABC transporter substrate-binding protein [Streptosporangiaceae bacterium]
MRKPIRLLGIVIAAALVTAGCGGLSSPSSPSGSGGSQTQGPCPGSCKVPLPGQVPKNITIGFGQAGVGPDFLTQQSRGLKLLAKRYGWKVIELNNNSSGPTAVSNVEQFIEDKVNYIIEFQVDSTVNPVICQKAEAAKIPVITLGIPGPCEYFTSDNDHVTGVQAGVQLGNYAKQHWDCKPDLVLLAASSLAGDASPLRVGGDIIGIQQVCPNIPSSDIVQFQMNNDNDTGIADARNALLADPTAGKILVGGLNDLGVSQAMTAAEQLNRAADLYAWGGDGSDLAPGADAHLGGSIQFFLEAGTIPAFEIALELAAKEPVHKGFSPQDPTLIAITCPMTVTQALAIPAIAQRETEEVAAFPKKTAAQLFCPK